MSDSPVLSSRTIFTSNGIIGGGDLNGDRTLGLEPIRVTGTGPKPSVDQYGRVIALTGFSVTDFTETLGGMPVVETRRIITLDGLIGGGPLNADLTLSLAVINPTGTGTVPLVDQHGRVTGMRGLVPEDFITAFGAGPALSSTRIVAGPGLIGGGTLVGDISLGLAPVVQSGSGPRPITDQYGRVTGWSDLIPSDIDIGLGYHPGNPVLNLSDLTNPEAARTNLGLGTAAQLSADGPHGVPVLGPDGHLPMAYLSAALIGSLSYAGVWNGARNEPPLPDAILCRGQFYLVGVPGGYSVDGTNEWRVGDIVISNGSRWESVRGLLRL